MDKINEKLIFTGKEATIKQRALIKKVVGINKAINSCGMLYRAITKVRCVGEMSDCTTCGLSRRDFIKTIKSWGFISYRIPAKKDKSYKIMLKKFRGHNG